MLKFLYDDNQRVEPEWYIPIIPMVLINGAEGIGTGWSCKIPNYDIREVVNNIRRMLEGDEPLPMVIIKLGQLHPNRLTFFEMEIMARMRGARHGIGCCSCGATERECF